MAGDEEEDQRGAADEAWRLYTQDGMRPQDVPMDLQIKMGREATLNFFERQSLCQRS